jgi:two-component system, cell cycle sensor histidine kinase and response regulator CckA
MAGNCQSNPSRTIFCKAPYIIRILVISGAAAAAVIFTSIFRGFVDDLTLMLHGLFFLTVMAIIFSVHLLRRERAEVIRHKALSREKELLSMTLDGMGEGMIATCWQGRITLFNKMAEAITGWCRTDAIGKTFDEIYQRLDETTGGVREGLLEQVVTRAEPFTDFQNTVLVTKNGDRLLIEESFSVTRDLQGNLIGVAVLFRDVSSQRRSERETLQAEKLESLGILAGGIAHDFNNLLTAVLGNISLARMHVNPGSRIIEHLNAAEGASLRTRDLTQQLLTFARGGAPIKQMLAIGDLLADAAEVALRDSSVKMDLLLEKSLWQVEADPGQLIQVIHNLLINAGQAMPHGGSVEMRAENVRLGQENRLPCAPGNYVRITIKDQGIGISSENLPHIYDPYFTTKQKGSGLGLASSYSIIKRHGGYIDVDSKAGEGTTFILYLPSRGFAPEIKESEELSSGKGKILLMENDAMVRELTGELLGHLGYQVDFAGGGEEAIRCYRAALAANDPYRLVIMDPTVPNGKGAREAVHRILELDPAARVVVSSGHPRDPVMIDHQRYGFSGMLVKPYNIKELVQTINRLL